MFSVSSFAERKRFALLALVLNIAFVSNFSADAIFQAKISYGRTPMNTRLLELSTDDAACKVAQNKCKMFCHPHRNACAAQSRSTVQPQICVHKASKPGSCRKESRMCLIMKTLHACNPSKRIPVKCGRSAKKVCSIQLKNRKTCFFSSCSGKNRCNTSVKFNNVCENESSICKKCKGNYALKFCRALSPLLMPSSTPIARQFAPVTQNSFQFGFDTMRYPRRHLLNKSKKIETSTFDFNDLPKLIKHSGTFGQLWPRKAPKWLPQVRPDSSKLLSRRYIPKFYGSASNSVQGQSFEEYYRDFLKNPGKKKNLKLQNEETDYHQHSRFEPQIDQDMDHDENGDSGEKSSTVKLTESEFETLKCFKQFLDVDYCQKSHSSCQILSREFNMELCQNIVCRNCNFLFRSSSRRYYFFCRRMQDTMCAAATYSIAHVKDSFDMKHIYDTSNRTEVRSSYGMKFQKTLSTCMVPLGREERCVKGCIKETCQRRTNFSNNNCKNFESSECRGKEQKHFLSCTTRPTVNKFCQYKDSFQICRGARTTSACKKRMYRYGKCDGLVKGEKIVKVLAHHRVCTNDTLNFRCSTVVTKIPQKCSQKYCQPEHCFNEHCN